MSVTDFTRVDSTLGLVQDFWSPVFQKELRENTLWGGLLYDPNYTMESVRGGDTLKISRINKPTSTIKTIGTDADSFSSNVLSATQSDLVVNKRCVSSFKFEDLAMVMSQLEQQDSEIREALLADVRQQMNDYIKSQISPSTSSPDHDYSGVSDFSLSALSAVRTLAATAKWFDGSSPVYGLLSPSYMSDALDDTTLSAANAMGTAVSPILNNRFVMPRMGINLIEDNSLDTDTAYIFRPDFMKVVFGAPRFKISDLHPKGEFGYLISVDMPLGVVQLDDERVIKVYNS